MDKKLILLEYLLEIPGFITSADLSSMLNVSTKTISRYIRDINDTIEKYGYKIESIQGVGYGFNMDSDEKSNLKKLLHEKIIPFFNVDENFRNIFQRLISKRKYNIRRLQDDLFMSESSLKKYLKDIESYLSVYDLVLYHDDYGFYSIEGNSDRIVQCIVNYTYNLPSIYRTNFLPEISQKEEADIDNIIIEYLSSKNIRISDLDLVFFKYLILVCINEIRSFNYEKIDFDKGEYKDLFRVLESKFSLDSFGNLGNSIISWIESINVSQDEDEYESLKEDIIESLLKFNTPLTKSLIENKDLIDQLVFHMNKFIYRNKKAISIENPLISDIKKGFPLEFSIAYYLCKDISKKYGVSLDEDEIGFIAVYLATQKEVLASKKMTAVIICHYGFGTASLLKERIENQLPEYDIKGVFPYSMRKAAYSIDVDLYISSIKLDDCPCDYVYIHDIIGDDINKQVRKIQEDDSWVKLKELVLEDFIDLKAGTNIEAIRQLGKILEEKTYLCQDITEEVIDRELISTTDIGNLVAIPHCISSSCQKSFIALGRLDKPIRWGKEFVQLIFFIVFKDGDKENIKAFKAMYNFVKDKNNVRALLDDFSYEKFIDILKA